MPQKKIYPSPNRWNIDPKVKNKKKDEFKILNSTVQVEFKSKRIIEI